jgi:hypothetical protein
MSKKIMNETLEDSLNRFKKKNLLWRLLPNNLILSIAEFGAIWQEEKNKRYGNKGYNKR